MWIGLNCFSVFSISCFVLTLMTFGFGMGRVFMAHLNDSTVQGRLHRSVVFRFLCSQSQLLCGVTKFLRRGRRILKS
jgi:hypothetical protein